MNLKLQRPLVFFDLETTGLNVGKDKIIEISLLKVMPDGTEICKTQLLNPGIHIPEVTTEVHHITDLDVQGKPTFEEVADEIQDFMKDCDLAGFNSNKFDLPLLVEEFLRIGKDFDLRNRLCIDVQNIFHRMEPRNLAAAYRFYCQDEMENAHEAEADTRATYEVFKGQLEKYAGKEYTDFKTKKVQPFPEDIKSLSEFSSENRHVDFAAHIVLNDADEEIFNFGKYKGKSVREIFTKEPSYFDWMMKSEFPLYTKKVIQQIFMEIKYEQLQNKF